MNFFLITLFLTTVSIAFTANAMSGQQNLAESQESNAQSASSDNQNIAHPPKVRNIPWCNLNNERLRLRTFAEYPRNNGIHTTLLAQEGFVYVGAAKDDHVQCRFCLAHGKASEFDSKKKKHKEGCTPERLGNIPMSTIDQTFEQIFSLIFQQNQSQSQFQNRVQEHAPNASPTNNADTLPQNEEHLSQIYPNTESQNEVSQPYEHMPPLNGSQDAQAEAFSAGQASASHIQQPHDDQASAGVVTSMAWSIQNWSIQDNPQIGQPNLFSETVRQNSSGSSTGIVGNHSTAGETNPATGGVAPQPSRQSENPPQPSRQSKNPPQPSQQSENPPNSNSEETPTSTTSYDKLNIMTARPKRPEYALEITRLNSFKNWPQDHHIKPEALAKAGFFYTGYSDCARCFFCGGGLRNWEVGDDVWVEHARWFPKCSFMRSLLGKDFIDVIQDLNKEKEIIPYADVIAEMKYRRLPVDNLPKDNQANKLRKSVAVIIAIDNGFSAEHVLNAAKELKEEEIELYAYTIVEELIKQKVPRSCPPKSFEYSQDIRKHAPNKQQDQETRESLEKEINDLRQQTRCKVCLEAETEVVFLPCGHYVSCFDCQLALKSCPICRKNIKGIVPAQLSP